MQLFYIQKAPAFCMFEMTPKS